MKLFRCALTGVLATAVLVSSCVLPQLAARAAATQKTDKTKAAAIKLPSDAQVMARAKKTGARLTRGGLVQPNTKLKGKAVVHKPTKIKLSDAEKKTPVGKARKIATTRGDGTAYIFIKPQNVVHLGHIGWGYYAPNMGYYIGGSTENPATANWQSSAYIAPGWDNGYWAKAFNTESEMFDEFKNHGYYAYKETSVSSANPDLAWSRACYTRDSGFIGAGWNCLDHTYYILEGYGVTGMPWKQTHAAPNAWFNAFSGTGYQLP